MTWMVFSAGYVVGWVLAAMAFTVGAHWRWVEEWEPRPLVLVLAVLGVLAFPVAVVAWLVGLAVSL